MLIGAAVTSALLAPTQTLFEHSSMADKLISGVIVCGGGATVPYIQKRLLQMITEASGHSSSPVLLNSIEPSDVCATGAAIQAKVQRKYSLLLFVCSAVFAVREFVFMVVSFFTT